MATGITGPRAPLTFFERIVGWSRDTFRSNRYASISLPLGSMSTPVTTSIPASSRPRVSPPAPQKRSTPFILIAGDFALAPLLRFLTCGMFKPFPSLVPLFSQHS
jgi:hypothetical protein